MSEVMIENQVIFSKNYMVRCMIDNSTEEHIANLSAQLNQLLKERFPQASCELPSIDDYWKYPGTKEIIHKVADIELYGVSRFIKTMPLSWNFRESKGYEVNIEKTFHNETAIWSQNTHPEESFLILEVSWVHIYTWPEDWMMSNVQD